MKKVNIFLLLFIFLQISLTGCQNINSTSVSKENSFLGVTFDLTQTQVQAILGTVYYSTSSNGIVFNYYGSNQEKRVGFISGKSVIIETLGQGYSIRGITVGNTLTYIKSILGNPESSISSTQYYYHYYPSYNIMISYNKTNDTAAVIGIYDSSKTGIN